MNVVYMEVGVYSKFYNTYTCTHFFSTPAFQSYSVRKIYFSPHKPFSPPPGLDSFPNYWRQSVDSGPVTVTFTDVHTHVYCSYNTQFSYTCTHHISSMTRTQRYLLKKFAQRDARLTRAQPSFACLSLSQGDWKEAGGTCTNGSIQTL